MTTHRFASATFVAASLFATAASAQAQAQAPAAAGGTEEAAPTLSITLRAQADSITVRQRGDATARIWADPGGEGVWKFDRGPLPDPIPVGRTFRNVAVALDAHATIKEDGGVRVDAAARPTQPTPTSTNGDH